MYNNAMTNRRLTDVSKKKNIQNTYLRICRNQYDTRTGVIMYS